MRRQYLIVIAIVLAVLIGACGEHGGSGSRGPNLPPDTQIVSGPPQGSTHSYAVEIHWKGTDSDGRVVSYDIAWHDGAISCADMDTLLDWDRVTATDSTFMVNADTCSEGGATCYHGHTFCVRAVDNDGAVDPEPAYVSFTATSIAPKARFIYPPRQPGQSRLSLPSCVTLRWSGTDEDGWATEYRYTYKPYDQPPVGRPYGLGDRRWSPWTDDHQLTIRLDDSQNPWSFYVLARDNAGAEETVFEDGRNQLLIDIDTSEENVPFVKICCYRGSCLGPRGSKIACRDTDHQSEMDDVIDVATGDTLCFEMTYTQGKYASHVTRIAFLVNDNGEPGSWEVASDDNPVYPPPGELFLAWEAITTVYAWAEDDYCEWGSTNRAYIRIRGVSAR